LALGINGMVGVGIFFAPAKVAAEVPGLFGVGVYLLTASALAPVACTYAILGGRFEEDGGPFVWANAAFGSSVGFAVGWVAYVSALFSTSAVLSGLAESIAPSLPVPGVYGTRLLAAGSVVVLASVVASGLRPSAMVWSTVTVLKLVPLVLLVVLFASLSGASAAVSPSPLPSLASVGGAALIVVFATQGFEIVPVPAGSARKSRRAVPVATVASLVLVTVLYVFLHWACVRALPDLATSRTPLVDAARFYGGEGVSRLVAIGTTVSALGIAFGMLAMTPRYLSVLGRPDAFGAWIGHEDARRRVPHRALAVTAVIVLLLVSVADLGELFELSSVMVLTQYGVTVAALAKLAYARQFGLSRRQIWPVPLASGAILLIGRAADAGHLIVAASALSVGVLVLVLQRAVARRRPSV
jgi:amino acid transporter